MKIYQYSNKGSREENQDYVLHKVLSPQSSIFIIADGMGGYSNGGVSANVVAEAIAEFAVLNIEKLAPSQLLKESVYYSNDSLMLKRLALGTQKMGCVIAVLLIIKNDAYMTWLGDSRIYIFRNGKEVYRTEDHSIINELGKIKTLNTESYQKYASIVTKSVMGDEKMSSVEISHTSIKKNDVFIMCTDGFYKDLDVKILIENNDMKEVKNILNAKSEQISDNFSFIRIEL